ncbi:MAG TPA: signal peptidase I [Gallionella sp.]|nr:signal peptidase I [Gallionella sp.]
MDFALILFVLLLVTGSIWLLDRFVLAGKRPAGVAEQWWVEYAKSFFPVILVVFFIRSFLAEPFKIPSGSMIPTLQVGDFILVNKFTYGLRLPVLNQKVVQLNDPQRGDVMVFHYPENPSVDYIKRVVAVSGDTIEYRNKRLTINGVEQQQTADGDYNYVESGLNFVHTERRIESLGEHKHALLVNPDMPNVHLGAVAEFKGSENCSYDEERVRCKVPEGHYFMMGDNRDNSRDSRYWGFVPDNQIVGKAFLVWMNFSDLKRIGLSIN